VKRSLLTEAQGLPVAVIVRGANVHDSQLLDQTLESVIVPPPSYDELKQHLCLDKGYDNPTGQTSALVWGYIPHIRRIGEEKLDTKGKKKHPARRRVVERAHAWLNGCRDILVRYAKKACNYLGMIEFACALLWYRFLRRVT
jgi:putative transposase